MLQTPFLSSLLALGLTSVHPGPACNIPPEGRGDYIDPAVRPHLPVDTWIDPSFSPVEKKKIAAAVMEWNRFFLAAFGKVAFHEVTDPSPSSQIVMIKKFVSAIPTESNSALGVTTPDTNRPFDLKDLLNPNRRITTQINLMTGVTTKLPYSDLKPVYPPELPPHLVFEELQSVALHELGHSLSLDHSLFGGSSRVMEPTNKSHPPSIISGGESGYQALLEEAKKAHEESEAGSYPIRIFQGTRGHRAGAETVYYQLTSNPEEKLYPADLMQAFCAYAPAEDYPQAEIHSGPGPDTVKSNYVAFPDILPIGSFSFTD